VVPVTAPPIRDGVVGVEGADIVYVGDASNAPRGEDRDLGNAILLPGLVNSHTHLELTAMRGFLEELPFQQWVGELTNARRAVLDVSALALSARIGIVEGIRAGITTFADTCSSGVSLQAMRDAGVRGVMYQEVFGPDAAQCDDAVAGLRAQIAELRNFASARVRLGVSPHAPYSVSPELFAKVGAMAAAEGLPVAIHVAESESESQFVGDGKGAFADAHRKRGIAVRARGTSPIAHLSSTGVLGSRPLLIHCIRVDARDIGTIAAAGCAVAHCPASNAKLGHGIAPIHEMLAAGIAVGLGSDSVASNNRMDMLEEARLASLLQRARLQRHDVLPAQLALELATIRGARALGIDARVGSLEQGKAADLAAFPLDVPAGAPLGDIITAAVFSLPGTLASMVVVDGEELVLDGKVVRGAEDGSGIQQLADSLERWRAASRERG
jgi:cytosine/adenosine deaminase-related metal-dependent hydrolase